MNVARSCPWRITNVPTMRRLGALIPLPVMRDLLVLLTHLIVIVVRLERPAGLRSVVAAMLLRHQLLILNRGRKRASNLRTADRLIAGLRTLLVRPSGILRSAIVLKPATLLHLHQILEAKVPIAILGGL